MEKLSPMMQQYMSIKNKHKDHILFYRLGDFYEMFFDDAITASKELELTLTGKDCGMKERAPMCGIPYHSCDTYINKLVAKGYKVAICEQIEDPKKAKGVVKRDIVRLITPGTLIESEMLDEGKNKYICSLYKKEEDYALCFCDISTGEIQATQFTDKNYVNLKNELSRFTPSEILFNDIFLNCNEMSEFLKNRISCCGQCIDNEVYESNDIKEKICKQFKINDYEELGIENYSLIPFAIYALLNYIEDTYKSGLKRLMNIEIYSSREFMNLDMNSRRTLEITETFLTKEKKGSLLWVLDKTKTPMGKRMLRSYLEMPLTNPITINKRLNAVDELFNNIILRDGIVNELKGMYDLERLMTRIIYNKTTPRELKALEFTAKKLPYLKEKLKDVDSQYLKQIYNNIDELKDIAEIISLAIDDDPPASLKDGDVIKKGYNSELDEIRKLLKNTREYLDEIAEKEKEKTGIKNLKIGYNRVFGYYIEISKSNIDMVPENYIRKQTLVNGERFITEELKVLEEKILSAGERMSVIEGQLYEEVKTAIAGNLARTQKTALALAELDVFCSFAIVSEQMHYTKPIVDLSDTIVIKEGRHPVVEAISDTPFVANDTILDKSENQIAIITGPNMAGKSTYMRQTALIVIMAQAGCFVPAEYAKIGIVDGIFTRVGAADDLTSGQSTFMYEMNEVSYILKNATSNSLLILDEIGRGTSTFDGMSIARAVIEYISGKKRLGAKTLFATHYHELTDMEEQFNNIKNYNILVKKKKDDIIFLRKIVPGGTDDSFGIEVSKLAGIPNWIIKRAFDILHQLEDANKDRKKIKIEDFEEPEQISFEEIIEDDAIKVLKETDPDTLTPKEALQLIYDLKGMIK